jgi:hypothetical protein
MKITGDAERTLRLISTGVWGVALVVMSVSATTAADLFRLHSANWTQGLALGLAIDAALAVALVGDKALAQLGLSSRWGTALRWAATVMSLVLNCSAAWLAGDALGVTLHAIPPALLIVLTEAAQSYRTALAEHHMKIAAEQERLAAAARQKAEQEAQAQREQEKRQRDEAAAARRREREATAAPSKPLVLVKPTVGLDVPEDASLKDKARAWFMREAFKTDRHWESISAVECDRAVGASEGMSKKHIKGWRAEVAAAMGNSGTAAAGN